MTSAMDENEVGPRSRSLVFQTAVGSGPDYDVELDSEPGDFKIDSLPP